MPDEIEPWFRIANYCEAGLWIVLGVIMLVVGVLKRAAARRRALLAAPTFALFGVSDIIEAHTGAWWDPPWLLVWKGLCLVVLAALALSLYRDRRRRVLHP